MKQTPLVLLVLILACSNPSKISFQTWKGDAIEQTKIDSLSKAGYIIHYLDSTVTSQSKHYTVYFYHESAQYADLKKRHEGRTLQPFTLQNLNGETVSSKSKTGKPLMISCWSVVCKPCIMEMPILNQLKTKYGGQVNFIAIALEEENRVKKVLDKYPFEFEQLIDGEAYLNEIGIRAFPTTFLIDADGLILEVIEGTPVTISEDPSERSFWQRELMESYSMLISDNFGI